MTMKIKILKDKERQLEKELKIVKEEIELYQKKNMRRAEEIFIKVRDHIEKNPQYKSRLGLIINADDPREGILFIRDDIGGYNPYRTWQLSINNMSEEDLELLKTLPINVKKIKHYHSRSEFDSYPEEVFLTMLGEIW